MFCLVIKLKRNEKSEYKPLSIAPAIILYLNILALPAFA
jgi:hypothetical protein